VNQAFDFSEYQMLARALNDRWLAAVFFHWQDDRDHLSRPGELPLGAERWQAEDDPTKLRQRKPIPEQLFEQLAKSSAVADAERLRSGMALELDLQWRIYWQPPSKKDGRVSKRKTLIQMKRLVHLSTELERELQSDQLYRGSVLALELAHMFPPERDNSKPPAPAPSNFLEEPRKAVAAFSSLASRGLASARGWGRSRRRRRGRPQVIWPANFPEFTLRFLWDVRASGGRLTLDKNGGTGTLLTGLTLLRPYAPPRLIPNKLPLSTLARAKSLDNKIAAAAGSIANIWS